MDPNTICDRYMHFCCPHKEECKYTHDTSICSSWWQHGTCNYGDECKKQHINRPERFTRKPRANRNEKREHRENEENTTKYVKKIVAPRTWADEVDEEEVETPPMKANPVPPIRLTIPQKKQSSSSHGKPRRERAPITGRNTLSWTPRTKPCDLNVVYDLGKTKMETTITNRDVVLVPNLFTDHPNGTLYTQLMDEINKCPISREEMEMKWHGNHQGIEGTHTILNDRKGWHKHVPTFTMIVDRIKSFFQMRVEATRLNIYSSGEEYKPAHHDSAGVDAERAKTQNFTVALSLGDTRKIMFEHAKTKTTVSLPMIDGSIYCFSKQTNIEWRHGVLQNKDAKEGRISIILWGWIDGMIE